MRARATCPQHLFQGIQHSMRDYGEAHKSLQIPANDVPTEVSYQYDLYRATVAMYAIIIAGSGDKDASKHCATGKRT